MLKNHLLAISKHKVKKKVHKTIRKCFIVLSYVNSALITEIKKQIIKLSINNKVLLRSTASKVAINKS